MPRPQMSEIGKIVQFFRTKDLDSASMILDLCKDAVRERLQRSASAKTRAKEPPPLAGVSPAGVSASAGPAPVKPAAKKKAKAKAKATKATPAKAKPAAPQAPPAIHEEEPLLPGVDDVEDRVGDLQPV